MRKPSWGARAIYIVFALALVFGLSAALVPGGRTAEASIPESGSFTITGGHMKIESSGDIEGYYLGTNTGIPDGPYYVEAWADIWIDDTEPYDDVDRDFYGDFWAKAYVDGTRIDFEGKSGYSGSTLEVDFSGGSVEIGAGGVLTIVEEGIVTDPPRGDWHAEKDGLIGIPELMPSPVSLDVKGEQQKFIIVNTPGGMTHQEFKACMLGCIGAGSDASMCGLCCLGHPDRDPTLCDACCPLPCPQVDDETQVTGWEVIPGLQKSTIGPPGSGMDIIIEGGGGPTYVPSLDSRYTGTGNQNWIKIWTRDPGDCHVCVTLHWPGAPDDKIKICAEKKWGWINKTKLDMVPVLPGPDGILGTADDILDPAVNAILEVDIPGQLQHWAPPPPFYPYQQVIADWVFADFFWGPYDPEIPGWPVEKHLVAGAVVHWWLLEDKPENQAALDTIIATLGLDWCEGQEGWAACGGYPPALSPEAMIDALAATSRPGDATDQRADNTEWKDPANPGTTAAPNLVGTKITTVTQDNLPGQTRGLTTAIMHHTDPEVVIVVTVVEYPFDYSGENPICIEIGKKGIPPPKVQVKMPEVRWAGEKIVLEKKWGTPDQITTFQLEHPGLGTLEPAPWGWTIGEVVYAVVDKDGVASAILDSEDPGQADVKLALLDLVWDRTLGLPGPESCVGSGKVKDDHAKVVWFLKLEEVNIEVEDLDGEAVVVVQVKGWFTTNPDKSDRDELCKDFDPYFDSNGDGNPTNDLICLPAGRWVLPDDWPLLAGADWQTQRPWWDIMDQPGDGVFSVLGPLGPYSGVNTVATTLPPFSAEYPVIGPFSELQPLALNPVTGLPIWVATAVVPADNTGPIDMDQFRTVNQTLAWRTTVVPNFVLNWWDAPMPTAEVTFVIRDGNGSLIQTIKWTWETTAWDWPFYAVEIPANLLIPPLGYPEGYDWDSWNWGTIIDPTTGLIDTTSRAPYWFWTDLHLPPFPDDAQAIEVYSDNHGFAAVWLDSEDGPVTVTATADYPYLGKHPAMLSDEIVVWGQGLRLEGDVNDDGNIDAADALLIAKHIVGTLTLTGDDLLAADVNDSTVADAGDALLIAKYIVGTVTVFPGGIYIP